MSNNIMFADYLINEIKGHNSPVILVTEFENPPKYTISMLMGKNSQNEWHSLQMAEVSKSDNKVTVLNKRILDYILRKAAAFESTFLGCVTIVIGYRPAR